MVCTLNTANCYFPQSLGSILRILGDLGEFSVSYNVGEKTTVLEVIVVDTLYFGIPSKLLTILLKRLTLANHFISLLF